MLEIPVTPQEHPILSKKRRFVFALVGGLTTFVFGVCLLCTMMSSLFYGCFAWSCAPPRFFSLPEWEIPVTYYPEENLVGGLSFATDLSNEVQSAHQTTFWNHGAGLGIYIIYRFATFEDATYRFWSIDAGLENIEEIPIHFISGKADTARMLCGNPIYGGNVCYFKARYQEFVVYFRASIDRDMTMDEFNTIVRYIDQRAICAIYDLCETE